MFSKLLLKIFLLLFIGGSLSGCAPDLDATVKSYRKISRDYQRRLAIDPDNKKLKIKLAKFYYEFKDYAKVEELLGGVEDKDARIILAKAAARGNNYDGAIEIFDKLGAEIGDGEYLYLYGNVLEEKNLFPKAVKVYNKVTGFYQSPAQARISRIKTTVEDQMPAHIMQIYNEAAPFLDEIKDEAAIIFLVDEAMEVTAANTSVSTIHVIEQVLKERGKNLAEVEIGYDSTYERVELVFARAISGEGKVAYAGQENIRDVSKYLNFPLYSNAKALIISLPSVEQSSFIEYKLKIHSSKLINEDDFSFLYRLRERYPIFKAKYELAVPRGKKVNFKLFNQAYAPEYNLMPAAREEDGRQVYAWELEKIKPLIPEYSMPPAALVNPAVLISSFSSWDEIYAWWKSLYEDKFVLEKETKQFIQELIKDAATDFEKAKKLYEFCAANIRYVGVEYGESGHEPHHAQEVFVNRYGDCKDQAILLVAMLKSAGLRGYPVLIPTREVYAIDASFPSLNFNHAICAVEIDGKLIFMDPTSETVSFTDLSLGDQEREVMVFLDDRWLITSTPQIRDNEVIYRMRLTLDKEETAVIDREVTTKGYFTSVHRGYLKYTHPSQIEEDIQKKMVEISPFSQLVEYKIEHADSFDEAPVLKYKFTTRKFLNPAGGLRIVPVLNEINADHEVIAKEKRSFPIDFEAVNTEKAVIKITLPSNLAVKYLPPNSNLETRWFTFRSQYSKLAAGFEFSQELAVKERFVAQVDYQEFKKDFEKVLYLLREEVILKEK